MGSLTTIAALGDISFFGPNADRPAINVFSSVQPFLMMSDLVVANLESPLIAKGNPVQDKCTLRGNPEWGGVLREAGVSLLSLANNHIMDYGEPGLLSTMESLKSNRVSYVGAGRNIKEACSPIFEEVGGRRIAFLARTSVRVSSPCYAGEKEAGVAFLNIEETKQSIAKCKKCAEKVIVLIHWGLEDYSYPSPGQRLLAREFIRAGADAILGHHPHVLQGIEEIGGGVVAYSLGNFVFDEFEWVYTQPGSTPERIPLCLGVSNREGVILRVKLRGSEDADVEASFTRIDEDGRVVPDGGEGRSHNFRGLSGKLHSPVYGAWWHAYSAAKEWDLRVKPSFLGGSLFSRVAKLRPYHLKRAIRTFQKSARIAAGRSDSPYD